MADNCRFTVWLHRIACLFGLAGALALSACGGGSGAPNNPFAPGPTAPPPLSILPGDTTIYSGVPTILTINGGVPPFRAFSNNSTVLPVAQTVAGSTLVLLASDVGAQTGVEITVQDSVGQTTIARVTVRAATLLNTFTVVPNRTECGTGAICSGQTGTATVTVQGPAAASIPGRSVKFEVVAGPFGIVTNNPAQPTVSTLTTVTDAAGVAQVIIRANVDAPTQPAEIRATDLTSGQQRTVDFLIVQSTAGSAILTVVPATAKITAAFKGECSAGARVDYYIYGGTPPYRITPSFPDAIIMVNTTVNVAGGFFEVITNGTCVDPMTFSVLDATGRQTTATLQNLEGSSTIPTPPVVPVPTLVVLPSSQTGSCKGGTVNFSIVVSGGTPPYNVSVAPPPSGTAMIVTAPSASNGYVGTIAVTGTAAGGNANVAVRDSSSPQGTVTATITCS